MFGAVDEDGNRAFAVIDDRTGATLGEQIKACVKAGSLIRRCVRASLRSNLFWFVSLY